jgi:hypothetical protein
MEIIVIKNEFIEIYKMISEQPDKDCILFTYESNHVPIAGDYFHHNKILYKVLMRTFMFREDHDNKYVILQVNEYTQEYLK